MFMIQNDRHLKYQKRILEKLKREKSGDPDWDEFIHDMEQDIREYEQMKENARTMFNILAANRKEVVHAR